MTELPTSCASEAANPQKIGRGPDPESESYASCPVCSSPDVTTFVTIDRLPAHVSAEVRTLADAKDTVTGEVGLTYCHGCGFIYNRRFEPEKVIFEPGYSASLAGSATFREYVGNLVRRLVSRYGLHNKSILEIGCGDGYLLRELCRAGGNEGTGIDPTVREEHVERVGDGSVRFIADYFSDRYASRVADFVCSMSMFETVPDPRRFLSDLRAMIGARDDTVVYFEVPNANYMFEREASWSIYYEQFGHFTSGSLANLFRRCGFEVLDTGSCYAAGQYVYVEARPSHEAATGPCGGERHPLPESLKAFASAHDASVERWKSRLEQLESEGRKVMAWGSGGKGNTFLNLLRTGNVIRYVVDINPQRHGLYIPGSAQQIVAPEFVAEYRPDVILITNPIYEQEIRKQVAELGVTCEFMFL